MTGRVQDDGVEYNKTDKKETYNITKNNNEMKKKYETPQIEVIEIEIEDAVLQASTESITKGVNWQV